MSRSARLAAVLALSIPAQGLAADRSFRGITEPLNDATVSATVAGRVGVILKKEGDFVRKGDVILQLEKDEQDYEARRRKVVSESQAELQSARSQAETLEKDYAATKQVFDATQSVSEEELWKKDLDRKMAVAERDRLEVQEKREDLEYRIAVAQLEERLIRAPFDGLVVKIHPQVGESTSLQDPLVRVADVRKCRFITYVEAVTAPKLAPGMAVSLRIEGPRTTYERKGVVEFASPVVDPSSGLREVKVLFDNATGEIQPGVAGSMVVSETGPS